MNLRALRTLVALEESGGFAELADQLGLTVSAVSAQLKTLEEEVRLPLLDRRFRPPALTPAGRRVAERARRMLADADAIAAMAAAGGAPVGRFRLGFVLTASVRRLPSFLARAAAAYPEAQIDIVSGLSGDLIDRTVAGLLDAAVVTRPPTLDPCLDVTTLAEEELVLARSAETAALARDAAVREGRFIQFAPGTGIGLLIAERLKALSLEPREIIALDTMEAVMGCVNASVGFSILPVPDAKRYAEAGVLFDSLAGPGGAPPPLFRELSVVMRRESPSRAALQTLTALL